MMRHSVIVLIAAATSIVSIATTAATGDRAGPDEVGFDEIIFVKRKPYSSDHYYTDINNGTSSDRFVAENGIYIYDLRTGRERLERGHASLGKRPGIAPHTGHPADKRRGRLLRGIGFPHTGLSMLVIHPHDPAATFDFLDHEATSRKAFPSLFLLIRLTATG